MVLTEKKCWLFDFYMKIRVVRGLLRFVRIDIDYLELLSEENSPRSFSIAL